MTAAYYFTKWIDVIPTRQATNTVILEFLVSNILSIFGCPRRVVTDNAKAFTYNKMVKFFSEYNIILSHLMTYYPQRNGLEESSNKILVRVIKKLLQDNKKAWKTKLKFLSWTYKVSTKRSIGTSPFQLVYGTEVVFPSSLGIPVRNILLEQDVESIPIQRRINSLAGVQQVREGFFDKSQNFQDKVKKIFYKKTKVDDFLDW